MALSCCRAFMACPRAKSIASPTVFLPSPGSSKQEPSGCRRKIGHPHLRPVVGGQGIEHVIDAMPSILERFPDTVYIVLGATHPHVKAKEGETYRLMLENRAQRLGVARASSFTIVS